MRKDNKKKKQNINPRFYSQLKEISVKSGFQKENRKRIYSLLFEISEDTQKELLFESLSLKVKFQNNFKLPTEINSNSMNHNTNGIDVLKKDISRSIYNQIRDTMEENDYQPLDLKKFENPLIFFFNSDKYYYYQGFLDMAVYVFVLFPENKLNMKNHPLTEAFAFLSKFSELFLKDYLIHPTQSKDLFLEATQFLKDIINLIDFEISQLINQTDNCLSLILSWIITLMTHNLSDITKGFRLLDYLILAEPYAIYVLSAQIISQELESNQKSEDSFDLNSKLQSIDLDLKINDEMIKQTENYIISNRTQIEKIQLKYINYFPNLCNPNYHGLETILLRKKSK